MHYLFKKLTKLASENDCDKISLLDDMNKAMNT